MSDIEKVFKFNENAVRTIIKDNQAWFVGKDICDILEYVNARDALAKHVDEEDKNTVAFRDGTPGNPNQTIINESGLYSLIFSSELPEAKKFKRWVTNEVLPSIRRTGQYVLPQSKNVYPLLVNAFGQNEADKIAEMNRTSTQVINGFPFHDNSYADFDEIFDNFKVRSGWLYFELKERNILRQELCKKGIYGLRYSNWIYRITDEGKKVGEETLNKHKKSCTQPFSFRFRKTYIAKLLDYYKPSFNNIEKMTLDRWENGIND